MAFYRCIGNSSQMKYVHKWDFTKSLVDEITGDTIDISHCIYEMGVGIKITDRSAYLPVLNNEPYYNWLIEIDISDMTYNVQNSYDAYLLSTSGSDYGLAYYYTSNNHGVDNNMWKSKGDQGKPYKTDGDYFKNSTIKFFIGYVGGASTINYRIYKNDTIVYQKTTAYTPDNINMKYFYIGHPNNKSFYDVTITGIRVINTQNIEPL